MLDLRLKNPESRIRFFYLVALLVFCIGVALYSSNTLGVDIIYTHLFYLPIFFSALWFYKKSLWIAALLSLLHIGINYFIIGEFVPNAFLRSLIFFLVAYVVGTISEKKDQYAEELARSREQLQEEQGFLATILHTQGALVVVLDASGCIVRFNRACEQTTGYTFAEVKGLPIWDIFLAQKEKEDIKDTFQMALQHPNKYINHWKTKDGALRLISWSNASITGGDGSLNYVVATGIDITEQKKAEEALKAAQREKTLILENLTELITYQDRELSIIWGNTAAGKRVEMDAASLVGKKCHAVWYQRSTPCEDCPVLDAMQTGKVQSKEMSSPDGRYWSVKASPVFNEQEEIVGAVETILDITDRKRAELELQTLNTELEQRVKERTAELEALNRELDAFSYSVSHDLRAPLRSIDGFSQALLEDYGDSLDEQGQDYLRRVCDSSQRMSELIDDLLKLSRVTRLEMSREKVDLSALAVTILAQLQEQEPQRQVETSVAFGISAMGDASLLRIALENIIGNAWKFTGGVDHARIEFGATAEAGQTIFYVRDNGAGFNMDYGDKIFKPFNRLHDEGEYKGTGIGLSIVARIMQRHGGKIWAYSEPGQGAVFYFTLP